MQCGIEARVGCRVRAFCSGKGNLDVLCNTDYGRWHLLHHVILLLRANLSKIVQPRLQIVLAAQVKVGLRTHDKGCWVQTLEGSGQSGPSARQHLHMRLAGKPMWPGYCVACSEACSI